MTDFITTTELGQYLGRDLSADAGAALAVTMATETVKTLTEQDFAPATETIRLDGTGTDVLLLPQVPVSAAGTVVVNGGTLESDDYGVTSEGLLIRTGGTAVWSTWTQTSGGPCAYWPQGRRNVSVTYDHGYLSGTVADIPDDIRMVTMMIASRMVVQGVLSQEQVGQSMNRYAVASSDLTTGERAILRKYKQSL